MTGTAQVSPQHSHAPYRADIDGMRAIAVGLVLATHIAPSVMPGGFVGVDIFFVISGYLITGIIVRQQAAARWNYREFLLRRARRLLPALFVVLLSTALLGMLLFTDTELASLGTHLLAASAFASNILLWHEVDYFAADATLKPLLHLWSLGVEEQFYLLYPFLLMWLLRGRHIWRWLGLCWIVSLAIAVMLARQDPAAGFYMLPSRFWELLTGGMLALAESSHGSVRALDLSRARYRALLPYAGGVLLAASLLLIDESTPFPSAWALLPVIGAALLIADVGPGGWPRRLLGLAPMTWLGRISYPLYLWHWPLLVFLRVLAPDLGLTASTERVLKVALGLLSVLLAWLTYRFVELRFRGGRDVSGAIVSRTHLLRAYTPLMVMGVVAFVLMQTGGLPSRLPTREGIDVDVARASSTRAYLAGHADRIADPCEASRNVVDQSFCDVTIDRRPTIALLGDSHAEAFFPGLAEALPDHGVLLMGRRLCPPVLVERTDSPFSTGACRRFVAGAIEALASDSTIRTVILGFRGDLYASGSAYGELEHVVPVRFAGESGGAASRRIQSALRAGLARTIVQLQDAGKRVALVHGIPEIGFDPVGCLIGRPVLPRRIGGECGVTRSEFTSRHAMYRAVIDSLQQEYPAVLVIDASDHLCDSRSCSAMRDGQLAYSDDDHLSLSGSRRLGAHVAPIVRRAQVSSARRLP